MAGEIMGRVERIWKSRVEFCERHLPSFERIDARDANYGEFRYSMFTVLTQHIYADSITQLIEMGRTIEMQHHASIVNNVASTDIRYPVQDLARPLQGGDKWQVRQGENQHHG